MWPRQCWSPNSAISRVSTVPVSSWPILDWCHPKPPAVASGARVGLQGGQRCGAPGIDRGCLDLPLPGTDQPRAAGAAGTPCQTHPRYRVESTRTAVPAVPQAHLGQEGNLRRDSGDRPRTGGLRLGDRTTGAAERQLIGRQSSGSYITTREPEHREMTSKVGQGWRHGHGRRTLVGTISRNYPMLATRPRKLHDALPVRR